LTTMKGIHVILMKFAILLLCVGMIYTELEEIIEEREIALVRRQVPSVLISNMQTDTASVGTSLYSGDTLRTDQNGYAMVLFMDQSVTRVRPLSELIIKGSVNRDRSTNTQIELNRGGFFMNVNREANSEVEVGAFGTVASVKGTRFGALAEGFFWVEDGEIEVMLIETGEVVTLTENMFARVSEDGSSMTSGELSEDEKEELGSDYNILDSDLEQRKLRLRFRDANGQIREIEIDLYEQGN
jgi:hypothetical protein